MIVIFSFSTSAFGNKKLLLALTISVFSDSAHKCAASFCFSSIRVKGTPFSRQIFSVTPNGWTSCSINATENPYSFCLLIIYSKISPVIFPYPMTMIFSNAVCCIISSFPSAGSHDAEPFFPPGG